MAAELRELDDVVRKLYFCDTFIISLCKLFVAFVRKRNLSGDQVAIYWKEPLEHVPAPCFGKKLNEYVDIQGFATNDLWWIHDMFARAAQSESLHGQERMDCFVDYMTGRGMCLVEARYIWRHMVNPARSGLDATIRSRWAI